MFHGDGEIITCPYKKIRFTRDPYLSFFKKKINVYHIQHRVLIVSSATLINTKN
jgi:hypothetical protein